VVDHGSSQYQAPVASPTYRMVSTPSPTSTS
jgi:hypothetical protein